METTNNFSFLKLKDIEVVSKAIEDNIDWLYYTNRKIRGNYDLAFKSAKIDGESIFHFNTNIIDKKLIKRAIKTTPEIFPSLPLKYRNDKSIVLLAIKKDFENFKYTSKSLKNDYNFCKKILNIDPYFVLYMNRKLWEKKEIQNIVLKDDKVLRFLFNSYFSLHGGSFKENTINDKEIQNDRKKEMTKPTIEDRIKGLEDKQKETSSLNKVKYTESSKNIVKSSNKSSNNSFLQK